MQAHVLETMPRALYDSWLLTIYDPRSISADFHGLELVMLLGFGLTLGHALRERRNGRPLGLFLWLSALFYGVWMELLTYNTIDNFSHSQFTVMFFGKQLPLYVVLLYPTFIYVAVTSARKLKTGALATFFTAGLVALMLDAPFDIMGPDCGWWIWHEGGADPGGLVAYRWLGVPVSSYCWHLLFDGAHAPLTRRIGARLHARLAGRSTFTTLAALLPISALVGVLAILVGILVMMPFHLFRALGLSDGQFTISLLVTAGLVFFLSRNRSDAGPPLWGLLGFVLAWYFFFLALAWQVYGNGEISQWREKALVVGLIAVVAVVVHTFIHFRGRTDKPPGRQPARNVHQQGVVPLQSADE